MPTCEVVEVAILTDKRLTATINRQKKLSEAGLWSKGKLEKYLKRPRNTINQWDSILISCLPDYANFWQMRKPLNDYQRWVLEQISNYQNRRQPFKTIEQIQTFLSANADKLTFSKYMEQYTK